MWTFVFHFLSAAAVPFLTGLATAAVKEWLRNKSIADAGAKAEHEAQVDADAAAAVRAKGVADEIHGLSDAEFARRADRWAIAHR